MIGSIANLFTENKTFGSFGQIAGKPITILYNFGHYSRPGLFIFCPPINASGRNLETWSKLLRIVAETFQRFWPKLSKVFSETSFFLKNVWKGRNTAVHFGHIGNLW